jgi:hypothetical protein
MTLKDITMILSVLKASYPNAFKSQTENEALIMRNLWFSQFKNVSADAMNKAIQTHINQSKYMPTIAEVRDLLGEGNAIEMKTDKGLTDQYRKMLIDYQDEWRETGKLPSMENYEKLYNVKAVIKKDGNIELQWINKTKNNLQKY